MKQNKEVTKYITSQPALQRKALKQLRSIMQKAAPLSEEVISYKMPAYKFYGMLLWMAGHTNHYAIYPFAKTIVVFKAKLKQYGHSKGTIKFPLNKPVPVKLITSIIKYKVRENLKAKGA